MADTILSPGAESFGALLRRLRVEAALSQEALAARAGVSTRAISDLERGVKLRPYLETVRLLADALGLDPAQRAAFATAARPSARVQRRRRTGRSGYRPPATCPTDPGHVADWASD